MVELLQKKAAEGKVILINRGKGATDRMKLQGALRQGWALDWVWGAWLWKTATLRKVDFLIPVDGGKPLLFLRNGEKWSNLSLGNVNPRMWGIDWRGERLDTGFWP